MRRQVTKIPAGKSPAWLRQTLVGFEFEVQDKDPENVNFNGPEDGDHTGEAGDFALFSDLEAFLRQQGRVGLETIAYFKEIERERDIPIPYIFFLRVNTELVD